RDTSPDTPRFPPLEVCVRRPRCVRRATFMGPTSANLHNGGHSITDKLSAKSRRKQRSELPSKHIPCCELREATSIDICEGR
ncbi:MAG: hypothetical protein ACLQDM_17870, partial [Bradyrhizobium sp.]